MFLEDRESSLPSGEDGLSELYDLPVPRGERPLGGEPVPYASEELVALLDGLGVLGRGAGVRRTQRGEQHVEKLPAVRRRSLDDPYVVGEERDDAGPGGAGGEVGEGRGGDPVDGDALLLPRGVADGHVTFARRAVDRYAGLGAGEVRAPPDDLVLLRGAGRSARDVEGYGLEQVGLPLGVVPHDYVQAGGEQGRGVDVVAEVDQAQGPQVGAQVATSNRSSTTSITSPFSSFLQRRVSISPFTLTSPAWIRTFASPPDPTRLAAFSAWPSVVPGGICKGQLRDGSRIGIIRYRKSGSSPFCSGTMSPGLSGSLSLKTTFSESIAETPSSRYPGLKEIRNSSSLSAS